MDPFDYIIVGAGSAGCVLAGRLSEDPGCRVLVLEAGGTDRRAAIRVPIGYGRSFHDPAVNWRFRAEPEPGLNGRDLYWPRGRVLGGSSSINAMQYCRGLPEDYDDWGADNPGWDRDAVAAVYDRIERRVAADGTTGGNGPLWVSDHSASYHPIRRHYLDAIREAGLPEGNPALEEGAGPYRTTTRRGWRCSAADAFLRPAMGRANLEVVTGAEVTGLVFAGARAMGVSYLHAGAPRTARCRGEVILAAGAVKSPQILQLAGIGPGATLAEHGIAVRVDNGGVGGALQDHLGIDYAFRATEPTLNQTLGTWAGCIRAGWQYLTRRTGPLSIGVNQMGGLVRSGPAETRADIQLYFNPLTYSTTYANKRPLLRPDPWPGFVLGFNSCRPTSRGRIDIASPDPLAAPRIAPNYLSTNEDIAQAITGGRLIERIMDTTAIRRLVAGPNGFNPMGASDDAILADFRDRATTVFHACGTCRMAPRGDGGVVDPALKVYGVEGLRVADASIFPNITSANTNAPSIMVGMKAADIILAG